MHIKNLFSLQVGIFLLCAPSLKETHKVAGFEELREKVVSLYKIMGKYDVRKYYIREKIRNFFCTDEDMDGFIFEKNYEMAKKKIRDGRVLHFSIIDITEYNESVGVKIVYKVKKFLPIFYTSIITLDEWIKTEDGWCILSKRKIKL